MDKVYLIKRNREILAQARANRGTRPQSTTILGAEGSENTVPIAQVPDSPDFPPTASASEASAVPAGHSAIVSALSTPRQTSLQPERVSNDTGTIPPAPAAIMNGEAEASAIVASQTGETEGSTSADAQKAFAAWFSGFKALQCPTLRGQEMDKFNSTWAPMLQTEEAALQLHAYRTAYLFLSNLPPEQRIHFAVNRSLTAGSKMPAYASSYAIDRNPVYQANPDCIAYRLIPDDHRCATIILFQGTNAAADRDHRSTNAGVVTDFTRGGIALAGLSGLHRQKIRAWVQEAEHTVLVGHSLGAHWVMRVVAGLDESDRERCDAVCFCGPGLPESVVGDLRNRCSTRIRYLEEEHDVVHWSGSDFPAGEIYSISVPGFNSPMTLLRRGASVVACHTTPSLAFEELGGSQVAMPTRKPNHGDPGLRKAVESFREVGAAAVEWSHEKYDRAVQKAARGAVHGTVKLARALGTHFQTVFQGVSLTDSDSE